jgi:AAA domain, putative AbiEii toxin, Type IV TA system
MHLVDFEGLTGSLRELASVNVLVGPNGCGKTRVLRSLGLPIPFGGSPNEMSSIPVPSTAVQLEGLGPADRPFWVRKNSFHEVPSEVLSDALKSMGQPELSQSMASQLPPVVIGKALDQVSTHSPVWNQHGVVVKSDTQDIGWWTAGTMRFAEIKNVAAQPIPLMNAGSRGHLIVLVEEPETSLHPSMHRECFDIIADWAKSGLVPEGQTERWTVQVFVTTHSPSFIAAAANDPSAKIYMLQRIFQTGKKIEIDFERGLTGPTALAYGGASLGSALSDFLPNRIAVFSDGSVIELLSAAMGGQLPFLAIRRQGDPAAMESTIGLMNFAESVSTFYKSKPFDSMFEMEVFVVFDDATPTGAKDKLTNLENQPNVRVIKLRGAELEDQYDRELVNEFLTGTKRPKWTADSFKNYAVSELKLEGTAIGQLKCDLARFIGSHDDFSLMDIPEFGPLFEPWK